MMRRFFFVVVVSLYCTFVMYCLETLTIDTVEINDSAMIYPKYIESNDTLRIQLEITYSIKQKELDVFYIDGALFSDSLLVYTPYTTKLGQREIIVMVPINSMSVRNDTSVLM